MVPPRDLKMVLPRNVEMAPPCDVEVILPHKLWQFDFLYTDCLCPSNKTRASVNNMYKTKYND